MFEAIKSWLSYRASLDPDIRNGTKIAVNWLVFSGILIVWLLVGLPCLAIFYPQLASFAPHLSSIIVALIGGATVSYSVSEVRKTLENIKKNGSND